MNHPRARGTGSAIAILAALVASLPAVLSAQAVQGRLVDARNGRPVDLGLVVLLTAEGDSVGASVTNREGRFHVAAPGPGSFLLRASAFGYEERVDGVFELGDGGRMTVDFLLPPTALPVEEILVDVEGPLAGHPLVRNGFVDRARHGMGHFITPRDLERSPYRETEMLFSFIPRLHVASSRDGFASGDRVLMSGPGGRCMPHIYVDGIRTQYDPSMGMTLSRLVPIGIIEGVEIYRGPAEVPAQYSRTERGERICGVILFWTKR